MFENIKNYVKGHTGEITVYVIMAAVSVGIGLSIGLHPLDALAHGRR